MFVKTQSSQYFLSIIATVILMEEPQSGTLNVRPNITNLDYIKLTDIEFKRLLLVLTKTQIL